MKSNNVVQQKSFAFAIRIVNVYKYLTLEKKEFVLSKQLLRSGTSIGANIEESIDGQSDKDFLSKSAYRDWETDRKSTRLNSSHRSLTRMPSSA